MRWVCLCPSFRWCSLHLPTKRWPGWVDLGQPISPCILCQILVCIFDCSILYIIFWLVVREFAGPAEDPGESEEVCEDSRWRRAYSRPASEACQSRLWVQEGWRGRRKSYYCLLWAYWAFRLLLATWPQSLSFVIDSIHWGRIAIASYLYSVLAKHPNYKVLQNAKCQTLNIYITTKWNIASKCVCITKLFKKR